MVGLRSSLIAWSAFFGVALATPVSAAVLVDLRLDGSLSDSSGNGHDAAVLTGAPSYSADVPPGSPHVSHSLALGPYDSLIINSAFPFDSQTNATLEFWVKPTSGAEGDLFWTTGDPGDLNRFNIGTVNGTLFGDYRSPNGTLHSLISGGGVNVGQWTSIAIVKAANTYTTYVDGSFAWTATDVDPALPNGTAWTINGRRVCCGFSGLVSDIRISDAALTPAQFETALPEPASWTLLLTGFAGLGWAMRRRQSGALAAVAR